MCLANSKSQWQYPEAGLEHGQVCADDRFRGRVSEEIGCRRAGVHTPMGLTAVRQRECSSLRRRLAALQLEAVEQNAAWRAAARRLVPARSGRQQEHAANKARGGHRRVNLGIGRGQALGTELAQRDFRKGTYACPCGALIDAHWRARAGRDGVECAIGAEGCSWCGTQRRRRAVHVAGQLRMAAQLAARRRRLLLKGDDGIRWVLPRAAADNAVATARARARMVLLQRVCADNV